MLNYENYVAEVFITSGLAMELRRRGIADIGPHLPGVQDFYEKQLLPRLKKVRKWKGCYRFRIIYCCISDSARGLGRKRLVETLGANVNDIVFDASLPVFEGEPSWYLPPMFWLRGLVLKA